VLAAADGCTAALAAAHFVEAKKAAVCEIPQGMTQRSTGTT